MVLQLASAESAAPAERSTRVAASTAAPAASSQGPSAASAPAAPSPAPLSTDMQIDSQHQIYYEYVDDQTGDVVFEIPPEALRKIGESLNLPLLDGASIHSVDVES
jgi:hypothetical protein